MKIELDSEAEKKAEIKKRALKRKRKRAITAVTLVVIIIAAVIVAAYFYLKMRTYSKYSVSAAIDLGAATDSLSVHKFEDGYIQCTGDGVTYFDRTHIIWSENFEMSQPVLDIAGGYLAVADMKQSDVYLYDKSGQLNRISTSHEILDVEVSSSGMIALATNDNDSNYIELKDRDGNELLNAKSIFSSSGYLSDISLSEDGMKLAAAFNLVEQGALESKLLFYDFSGNKFGDDVMVGAFNQYKNTLLTSVEFMRGNVVCTVGDNAVSFYDFKNTPSLIYEALDLDWEIQSLNIDKDHALIITRDDTGENNYKAKVLNTSGEEVADVGFDFSYSKARLAGKNILLYSTSSACRLYAFSGLERYSGSFDEQVEYMLPYGSNRFVLTSPSTTSFIQLK